MGTGVPFAHPTNSGALLEILKMIDPFHMLISAIMEDDFEKACEVLTNYSCNMTADQLTKALVRASARGNFPTVKILLDSGASPNGFLDQVPLISAVLCRNIQLIQLLIAAGADIDRQDENTYTALMYSISIKDCQIFNILLSAGANPEVETYDNDTALEIAERIEDFLKLEQMQKTLDLSGAEKSDH
jgi:ankyrin repeat protein